MSLDQSNKTDDGIRHEIAGHQVFLPEVMESELGSEAVQCFGAAKGYIDYLQQATAEVMGDKLLSDIGKAEKLKEVRYRTIDTVAAQLEGLENFAASIDNREAELFKVPELHPQNAADAIIDRELRDYWRSLSSDQRTALKNAMLEGPEHQRLEIALLRSPYAQLDSDITSVREGWKRSRRLENPAEYFAIEADKSNLDWGRQAMAHIAPIALRTAAIGGDEVITRLVRAGRDRAAKAFGFDSDQIEQARRQLEINKLRGR